MKINKIFLFVLLLIALIYLTGCTTQPPAYQQQSKQPPTTPLTQPSKTAKTQLEPQKQTGEISKPLTQVKEFNVQLFRFSFNPETITVNQGDKVRLRLTSNDVAHGFGLPDFGINEAVDPGETKTVEFIADKKGTFTFRCTVFCGSGHSGMAGKLIVQ